MPPSCALLGGFAIGARDALLWQHDGNACPAEIRQAQRTPHALRTHARTSDKIDVKIGRVRRYLQRRRSISSIYCAGDATRTRNVSEYMLVLVLCLVI